MLRRHPQGNNRLGFLNVGLLLSVVLLGGLPALALASTQAAAPILDLAPQLAEVDSLIRRSQFKQAKDNLVFLLSYANTETADRLLLVKLRQRLASIQRVQGELYAAVDQLQQAATDYSVIAKDITLAALYLDIAQLYLNLDELEQATQALLQVDQLMTVHPGHIISLRSQLAALHIQVERGIAQGLEARLTALGEALLRVRNSREQAELYLDIGRLYQRAQESLGFPAAWRNKAYAAYQNALLIANQLQDASFSGKLNAYIGQLYEYEARYDESLSYTRKAVFSAQDNRDDQDLFQWEWQTARIMQADHKPDLALDNYRQAIKTLQKVKLSIVLAAKQNFQRLIVPLYSQYLDLLLERSLRETDPAVQQRLRGEAVAALEDFRVSEVEDYFQSACVDAVADDADAATVDPATAIIYPIILETRLELIVLQRNLLQQFSVPVSRPQLAATTLRFRQSIENPNAQADYLNDAKQLYLWLVAPYAKPLFDAGIRNLVFVPEGPLRSIPMAALHDGSHFLVEVFSLAETPSLALTQLKKATPHIQTVLANGITEAVHGYPALPSVGQELQDIQQSFSGLTLSNGQFLLHRSERELTEGRYSIVHIATHGEFSSDYRNSFLLTYDNKLTMAKLANTIGIRKYSNDPLDLLVLSACQTAVGDDRAALGLAGVAIKAGARSAVATLWFINDAATATLMSEFYRKLSDPAVSKAAALRFAQMSLIQTQNRNHPYYWAPFLLLGNWL